MYDIIVIGGGVAGMTAALYALRAGKTVLVIEKGGMGGQITYSPRVENYPGSMSMSGNEFADRLLEQIIALGAQVEIERVVRVEENGVKRVLTEDGGVYEARAVIIAVGVKHRMLGIDGEDALIGSGISFCAVCDGDFYANQTVAVAGGGNSALQEATLLADVCKHVYIIQDLDALTGEEKLCRALLARENVTAYLGTTIEGFLTDGGEFKGLRLRGRDSGAGFDLECDGLFVAVGLIPENDAFANIVTLDGKGYIAAGEDCLTGHSGIFTAGDCRSKAVRQLTTAAADGSVAALAACKYIDS